MPLKHRKLFPGGQVVVGLRSSPAAGGDHGRPAAGTAIGRRGGSEGLQTRRPSRAPPWRRDPRWTRRSVTAVAWAAPTPNPPVVAHLSTRRHERPVLGRGRAASGALRINENGHTSWTPREPPMPRTRRSPRSRFSRARTARCRAPGAAGASLFFLVACAPQTGTLGWGTLGVAPAARPGARAGRGGAGPLSRAQVWGSVRHAAAGKTRSVHRRAAGGAGRSRGGAVLAQWEPPVAVQAAAPDTARSAAKRRGVPSGLVAVR